ncbi:hypothetical protein SELMODRAFT_95698 [Selaginella moellendorffii]|uniref:DYW domain-containing protein n=2 Tax=Selaginella moellendorffii TaxID=88036 RepID=D8RK02_SELML|nr:hypothetical protein SELMODRAFT_95698 [Selaginella moellendorffii]
MEEGRRIHSRLSLCGFHRATIAQNGLVSMYAKCGCLDEARAIFNGILERTVVSWSAMIGAYALHGRGQEALLLFHRMRNDGRVEPNAMTFTGVFNACGVIEDLEQGREIHALAMASGELKSSNAILENALLNMYVRCGSLEEARKVFDTMDHPDAFSWTSMITACTENCELLEALELFHRMNLEGIPPTSVTLASVLNACACSGALKVGKQIHSRLDASGFHSSVLAQTALLDMYAKCGSLECSSKVFTAMETRNSVSWTAMIAALAQHGQGDEALELFKEMNLEGMVADATTFICVLRACSHAGLIKESLEFFHSMVEDYAIAPTETHYCRALDTIGRAGRLQDAEELIHSMPFHPETLTWKTLLNACRIHSQAERATKVAELLSKLAPEDSMAYTLLGNVYAATGRYGDQMRVRKGMTDRGLKKVPGKSFIEVKNKVHEFVAGDRAHPSRDEILLELEKLGGRMREAGYVPNTKDVLHAVNEEEKEQLIGLHSEKLAIAFGLIATPPGTPLLIVKNLRVCSDCHAATKVIAKIMRRRIVVRDTHRFHHFEDGQCSCKDYW